MGLQHLNRRHLGRLGNFVPAQTPAETPSAPPPSLLEVIKTNTPMPVLKVQPANNPTSKPMDLRDGLLAHYPYSGNANDQSGNEYYLEVNGSTPVEDRFGMPNSAYAFDGQD